MGTNTIPNTTSGTHGQTVAITTSGGDSFNNAVKNCRFGKPIAGADILPVDFVDHIFIDLPNGSVRIEGNEIKTFVSGIYLEAGHAVISNNTLVNKSTSAWLTGGIQGIFSNTFRRVVISDNILEMDIGTNSGGIVGMKFLGTDDPGPSVSGNLLNLRAASGDTIGMSFGEDNDIPFGTITGNSIDIYIDTATVGVPTGIFVRDQFSYNTIMTISGNTIRTRNDFNNSDSRAINIFVANDDDGDAGIAITGNTIQMLGNDGPVSEHNAIILNCVHGNITGNNIRVSGRSNSPAQGNVVEISGHHINVSNNVIKSQHNFGGPCIRYDAAASNAGINSPGNISICNNIIFQEANARPISCLISGAAADNTQSIQINGNSIVSRMLSTDTSEVGIRFEVSAADGVTGISICDNVIREGLAPSAGNFRDGINVLSSGASPLPSGVDVSGNTITSANTNVVRSTDSAAISVNGCGLATINRNIVTGWVGTGTNRSSIRTTSITSVCINSNSLEYSGATSGGVSECIKVVSGTDAQVSANTNPNASTEGVDITVTGISVTSGSNLTA